MQHDLIVIGEDDNIVMFECSRCGARINYLKDTTGEEPNCSLVEGVWVPNADPIDSLGPCPE